MTTEYKAECPDCKSSGVYKGMGEHGSSAVVCTRCDGKGWILYKPLAKYERRKRRKGITRIYRSAGYYSNDVDTPSSFTHSSKIYKFSQAGCSYAEFLKGKRPKPVKDLYCPFLWSNQNMQNKTHPMHNFYKDNCAKLPLGHSICQCPKFYDSEETCWPTYEKLAKDWD